MRSKKNKGSGGAQPIEVKRAKGISGCDLTPLDAADYGCKAFALQHAKDSMQNTAYRDSP